jgi:phosphatidate cytidylyltransferase
VAVLLVLFLGNDLKAVRIISAIALAAVFTTVGFIGDIAESSFKRAGKLDDSGNILPGLGGAMDVLDSLIPVAPIFYAYLVLCS